MIEKQRIVFYKITNFENKIVQKNGLNINHFP